MAEARERGAGEKNRLAWHRHACIFEEDAEKDDEVAVAREEVGQPGRHTLSGVNDDLVSSGTFCDVEAIVGPLEQVVNALPRPPFREADADGQRDPHSAGAEVDGFDLAPQALGEQSTVARPR